MADDVKPLPTFPLTCDECALPVEPRDAYAVTWTEWSAQDQRHIKHLYPGTFHGACTTKAKERLDRERTARNA